MSKIKCPKCGKEIEAESLKCSECGYEETNKIAEILDMTGRAIIILGVIVSIVLGAVSPAIEISGYSSRVKESYNIILCLVGCASSIISGLLIIAFSQIIYLNQKIFNLLRK